MNMLLVFQSKILSRPCLTTYPKMPVKEMGSDKGQERTYSQHGQAGNDKELQHHLGGADRNSGVLLKREAKARVGVLGD